MKSKSLVAPKVEARDASFLDTSSDSDFISLRHLRRKRRLRVKKCFHGNRSSESDPSGGSEDEEEGVPPRVVLLCGPHGSGKTAAVYACATELGFKVHTHTHTLGNIHVCTSVVHVLCLYIAML